MDKVALIEKFLCHFESFFFQSGRDKKGAAIALFTARIHQPSLTSHQLVLKALVYQLDAALER